MPKTREGYYHFTGGIEAAIKRELAFAPYADMMWLETKRPDLEQAQDFARRIREKFPGKYVVSPILVYAYHMLMYEVQVVCVQLEPELQLVGARLLGCSAEELRVGSRERRVSSCVDRA